MQANSTVIAVPLNLQKLGISNTDDQSESIDL